jgi:D-galactarolactone cycloisomerase
VTARFRPVHIESIEVVPLRVPLDRVFRGSHYSMANRCTLITRVHTREGPTGEAYNGDECDAQATIAQIITAELAPLLTGQELPAPVRLWRSMLPPTLDILRDRRLVIMAMAAVDSAAWDAVGKVLGVPLWRLWGGSRSSLPVIAIGGYYGDDDVALEREMGDYRRLGIAGCKFKVGGASPEEDARRLSIARAAAGQDFILMADANQGYEIVEASRFARLVEGLDVRWFEEPVGWANDRLDLRTLRMRTSIPLAAGQSEHTVSGARDLISSGAIDVCNFDASWGGGPTAWLEVASVASAFGVEMAHHEEPQIAAQLLAAVPKGTYLECFHPDRDPLFWGLIANRSGPRDGKYFLTEAAGFGLELDETFIKRWRVDH